MAAQALLPQPTGVSITRQLDQKERGLHPALTKHGVELSQLALAAVNNAGKQARNQASTVTVTVTMQVLTTSKRTLTGSR